MKKQYFYTVEVTHMSGRVEILEAALKPHLGLGNPSDLYLTLVKSGLYSRVRSPKFVQVDIYK